MIKYIIEYDQPLLINKELLAKEFPLEGFIIDVSDPGGHVEAGIEAIHREAEDFRKKQRPVVAV